MTVSRPALVREAVRAIRKFHALGRRLPKKPAHAGTYGKKVMEAAAGRTGVNPDTLRKARVFADPAAGYSRAELDALCRLIGSVQPGQGETEAGKRKRWVFRPTHVIRLLGVPKGLRAGLQTRAVRGGWSTARLEAEIARLFGPRSRGGRKPAEAPTVDDWLAQAERLCETWRRWAGRLASGERGQIARAALPAGLQAPFREATTRILTLHRAVLAELGRRNPARQPRGGVEAGPAAGSRTGPGR